MYDVLTYIPRLDSKRRENFLHPAYRLILANGRIRSTYHEQPIQRDVFGEVDAVVAWSMVTCSYSGIEQALKCLLKMQDAYIDEPLNKGGDRHHYIGRLFEKLGEDEKHVIRVAFAIYRSLHDYIPVESADCFFEAVDHGYPKWRYFLLEGNDEEKWPPTTHPGAMIDTWSALSDIIRARQFTNHGLCTVKDRIASRLIDIHEEAFRRDPEKTLDDIDEVTLWRRNKPELNFNAYADLLYRHGHGEPLALDAETVSIPRILATESALGTLVDLVEQEVNDNDFVYFVRRAMSDVIVWSPNEGRFQFSPHKSPVHDTLQSAT